MKLAFFPSPSLPSRWFIPTTQVRQALLPHLDTNTEGFYVSFHKEPHTAPC